MKSDVRKIYEAFDGRLVGSYFMKKTVCEVLSRMPKEFVNFITKKCWFLSSSDDAWAFTFTGNDLKNMHLIFLSDELLREEKDQIEFSIAHEIGHVILKHKNSTFVWQSKREINIQEREANEFARKYTRQNLLEFNIE